MRQPVGVFTAILVLAATAFCADPADKTAPSIVAVRENGHTVWVNSESPSKQLARHSYLVYWSSAEQRWKPVPPPSAATLVNARNAAAEVHTFVVSRPKGASTSTNPNYSALSRGYRVSSAEIDKVIEEAASKHNVDANLVRALIKQESNFNPSAVSNKGAMGLMQLMPGTARQLGVTDPFDPQQNVDAGVRHLRGLLDNYNGDVRLGLAAYNAGEGAVNRHKGVPPYRETQDYVNRITANAGSSVSGPRAPGASYAPVKTYRDNNGVVRMTNTE